MHGEQTTDYRHKTHSAIWLICSSIHWTSPSTDRARTASSILTATTDMRNFATKQNYIENFFQIKQTNKTNKKQQKNARLQYCQEVKKKS